MRGLLLLVLLLAQRSWAQVEQPTDDYAPPASAQAESNWVMYSGTYAFRDGIYFDHAAFRHNAPSIPKATLLTRDHDPLSDFKRFHYLDSAGVEHRIMQDSVWGFASKDHVYIRSYTLPLGPWSIPTTDFLPLRIMGTLSHLLIGVRQNYADPATMGTTTSIVQQVQVLLNVNTGEAGNVSPATLHAMMADDAELQSAFMAVPKRKRNDEATIFQFIRRYNERHPLYFPR